jgi:hypothetical protein
MTSPGTPLSLLSGTIEIFSFFKKYTREAHMPVRTFSLPSILPDLKDVLGRLGYNAKKTAADEQTIRLVEDLTREAGSLAAPAGNTLDLNIKEIKSNKILLENGPSLESEKLSTILAGCRKVTLIACTIGRKLPEKIATDLKDDRITESVIMDAAASEAVEAFVNYIQQVLEREYRILGFQPVMRYSPGYGDLKLSTQKLILPLV